MACIAAVVIGSVAATSAVLGGSAAGTVALQSIHKKKKRQHFLDFLENRRKMQKDFLEGKRKDLKDRLEARRQEKKDRADAQTQRENHYRDKVKEMHKDALEQTRAAKEGREVCDAVEIIVAMQDSSKLFLDKLDADAVDDDSDEEEEDTSPKFQEIH